MWNGLQGIIHVASSIILFCGPPNSAILSSAAFAQFSISHMKTCLLSAFIISATILGFNHSIILLLIIPHSLSLVSLALHNNQEQKSSIYYKSISLTMYINTSIMTRKNFIKKKERKLKIDKRKKKKIQIKEKNGNS